jgi:GDSL-like Lipase/Acylhydrolase family
MNPGHPIARGRTGHWLRSGCTTAVLLWLGIAAGTPATAGVRPSATLAMASNPRGGAHRFPLAVLGDSDSQSYQDRVLIGPDPAQRGGVHRAATLQWTEALARLRSAEIDSGAWGPWGTGRVLATLRASVGLPARAPRKEDFEFNLAVSGAVCEDVIRSQVPALLAIMDRAPERWHDGVVVIRIGINDFGLYGALDTLAHGDADGAVQRRIQACAGIVEAAVAALRSRHPQVGIVLVGIFDNAQWPPYFVHWHSAEALARIGAGLDGFDNALRALAAADRRTAFFDDRQWFRQLWGQRDASGRPAYHEVSVAGSGLRVTNTSGDLPDHALVADGHAGLVWNVLWAKTLVDLLHDRFGAQVDPVTEGEAGAFIQKTIGSPRAAPLHPAVAAPASR